MDFIKKYFKNDRADVGFTQVESLGIAWELLKIFPSESVCVTMQTWIFLHDDGPETKTIYGLYSEHSINQEVETAAQLHLALKQIKERKELKNKEEK